MNRDWALDASCRQYDPELWFSDDPEHQAAAKTVCARCPARRSCQDDANRTDDTTAYGIRAGLTGKERTNARRRRLREQLAAA